MKDGLMFVYTLKFKSFGYQVKTSFSGYFSLTVDDITCLQQLLHDDDFRNSAFEDVLWNKNCEIKVIRKTLNAPLLSLRKKLNVQTNQ